jgi:hypothetical protein
MKKILGCLSGILSTINIFIVFMLIALVACQKNLSFENAGPDTGGGGTNTGSGTALNTWTFTANGHIYNGKVASAQFTTVVGNELLVVGSVQSGSADTIFTLNVQFPTNTLQAGSYMTSDPGTSFTLQLYPRGTIILAANALASPLMHITITAYDKATNTVEGTFAGDSFDLAGITVPITDGAFRAKLPG